jgi:hypothetical protein
VVYFFIIVLVVSFFLLALPYKKVYAWNGGSGSLLGVCPKYTNVHYCDTKDWCMREGMSEPYADKVAHCCSMVDIIHALDRQWHLNDNPPGAEDSRDTCFTQEYSLAIESIEEAGHLLDYSSLYPSESALLLERAEYYKSEALVHLGYSLHPLQDKYAHMNASCGNVDVKVKHGELGRVNVLNPDGSFREVKIQGDLFDNVDYDFSGNRESCPLQGQWYYLGQRGKYYNSRWLDTESATRRKIRFFVDYAELKNIYFQ